MLTFIHARILTEDGVIPQGWLTVRDGYIDSFGEGNPPTLEGEVINASGKTLSPGFLDIHVHGGGGHEAMDATGETLEALSRFYAQHGVTGFLPTTWTAPNEAVTAALNAIAEHQDRVTGAKILGAHVEGPYINPLKPGAQSSDFIRPADVDEFKAWEQSGVIKLVTVAPEYANNQDFVDYCVARGIAVSAGHTDATLDQMKTAVEHGVGATTHTFNAMRPLHHREPGTVGAALLLDTLYCEVIADGVHVHSAMVELLYKTKGAHRLILITDAVRGAGLPEGSTYLQDGRQVTVRGAGGTYLDDGTLAGSALTMDVAVKNFAAFTGKDIADFWPCFSLNPARWVKVDDVTGSIRKGKRADLILLDDQLDVTMTIIDGKIFEGG